MAQVKSQIDIYSNMRVILEKIIQDNRLSALSSLYSTIFENEILYAIAGRLIRDKTLARGQDPEGLLTVGDVQHNDIP